MPSKREMGVVTQPRTHNPERVFYIKRKRLNEPWFNTKAKKRRIRAKFAALSRKRNRRK
jgi:hypothetical protein